MKKNFLTIILLIISQLNFSQTNCERFTESYIPIGLNDAISFFECKWSKDDLNDFKDKDEETATTELHFGTGMWIRNNWKLWKGTSKISKYFRDLGIHHPDDMSSIILTSLHRNLNEKPIELDKQIKSYKDYWAESKRKQKEEKIQEFNKFKIGDKVEFFYEYDFISKNQEEKYENDECSPTAVVIELNKNKLELKVRLEKSCDKKGIIILKYDIWGLKSNEYKKLKEDQIEIMKKGEVKWTSYNLWGRIE